MDQDLVTAEIVRVWDTIDLERESLNDIVARIGQNLRQDLSRHKDEVCAIVLDIAESGTCAASRQTKESNDLELAQRLQEEENRQNSKRSTRSKAVEKKKARKISSRRSEKSVFHKPMETSPQLNAIVGSSTVSRPEAVKLMWRYIRENNLQDPTDKRFIICDSKFEALFKKKRVNCFTMNKDISRHLFRLAEVAEEPEATGDDETCTNPEPSLKVPRQWKGCGIFPSSATYHELQIALLKHVHPNRSRYDPEIVARPEDESLDILFQEGEETLTVSEMLRRFRESLSESVQRAYGM